MSSQSNIAKGGELREGTIHSYWLEGPDKAKTIPDQYGKGIDQILGQIKEKHLTKIESAFKDYQQNGGLLGSFLSNFKIGGVTLSMEKIREFAEEARGWVSAAQQGLDIYQDFKEGNYRDLFEKLGPFAGDGIMSLGQFGMEVYDGIKTTDWRDINSILGLVGKVTGVDIGNVLGITQLQAEISALMTLAQEYNLPNALGLLRGNIEGRPDINQQMLAGMGINAKLSQIETMEEMLKILGGPAVLLMNPTIIQDTLSNYRFPTLQVAPDLEKERNRLIKVLTEIDPTWDHEMISGKKIYKTDPWRNVSTDALTLFNDHVHYGVPCCIGRQYGEVTLKDGLNATYRYLQLT